MTDEEKSAFVALADRVEMLERTVGRLAHRVMLTEQEVSTVRGVMQMRWKWAGGDKQSFVPEHWQNLEASQ